MTSLADQKQADVEEFNQKMCKLMSARGLQEEHLSLLTGQESLAELQEIIIRLSERCPAGDNHHFCPFRLLGGLSHASMTRMVKEMTAETCQELFEQERICRTQAEFSKRNRPPNRAGESPSAEAR